MISRLRPYPTYKDSGFEWLREVPEQWAIRRTKNLLVQRSEKGFPNEPLLAATQTKGVVRKEKYENRTVLAMKDLDLLKIVRIGDFVISLRSFQGGIEYARDQGIISPAYTILYPSEPDHHAYLALVFKSHPFIENLSLFVTGIRQGQNIDYERLSRSYIPLPPRKEQSAIVRFLNHTNRRIQRYIQAKQKLLHLLEEQKQVIIHEAVTGRIDVRTGKPYPAYKPSGVEWLRDIPRHWEVRRLKNVADMRVSNVDKHVKDGENPVRLCNYVDVYNNDHITARMDFMHVTATNEEIERFRLKRDDVLITKDSETWDDIGVPALVTEPAIDLISGYHLALLRPRPDKLAGTYLSRALQSKGLAYQFHVEAKGVTRYGLSHAGIKSVLLPLPPLSEQTAIVHYLDKISTNIEKAITRVRSQIELFQEYRTCLIADVVTGRLDIREAAVNLPNDTV